VVQKIIECRKAHPGYGQDAIARLLKRQDIRISGKTVGKILRKYGFLSSKGKNTMTSRAVRKGLAPFEEVLIDVADLANQGHTQTIARGLLPRYEFLLRDVSTGASFLSFSQTLTPDNTLCFIQKICRHLEDYGLQPKVLCVLEDSDLLKYRLDQELIDFLSQKGITAKLISTDPSSLPPNSKSFYQLIDLAIYQGAPPGSKAEFYQQALEFERFFNLKRRDSKRKASPFEAAKRKFPELPIDVMEFKPLCLDECDCSGVSQ
jgi:hypothetical protein